MSTETPKTGQWLSLSCPRCKAKFRIKSVYGHMAGRCPNCGKPIEPPLPVPPHPYPPPPVGGGEGSQEPLGLVPIEEEWPEPAQLEGDDDRPGYEFGSLPSQWDEPEAPKPPDIEGYGLQGGPVKPSPAPSASEALPDAYSVALQKAPADLGPSPPETLPEAYPVDLPHAGPSLGRARREVPGDDLMAITAGAPATPVEDSERATPTSIPAATPASEEKKAPEKIPPPPPLPPSRPLVEGVYSFPWHLGSLKVWIFAAFQLGILGFLICLWLLGGLFWGFGAVIFPVLAVVAMLSGTYLAANFSAIVEDSAAGNDTFSAPEWFGERFGYLLHLIFIGFCSLIPTFFVGLGEVIVLRNSNFTPRWGALALLLNWGVLVALVPLFLVFPIFYLSSLTATSRLAILDRRVIGGFLRNPRSSLVLFLVSLILGSICYELGWVILAYIPFRFGLAVLLALAAGFVWSTCLLIYARLLGRVGWVISQGGVKVKKRKRRRKKLGPDDWGSVPESVQAERPATP